MRTFIILLLLLVGMIACTTKNKLPAPDAEANAAAIKNDTLRIANDELEYEVIIIDPGFNSWLLSRARPRGYYSQQHMETKNRLWIMEWNTRSMTPRYANLYQMRIDYDSAIDYGYEVNYLIYNYLVYFQQTHGQSLGGGIVPQF